MPPDLAKPKESLKSLQAQGIEFFETNEQIVTYAPPFIHEADSYWELLEPAEQDRAQLLQNELLADVRQLANSMRLSGLVTEADRRDLSRWTKGVVAWTATGGLTLRAARKSPADALRQNW